MLCKVIAMSVEGHSLCQQNRAEGDFARHASRTREVRRATWASEENGGWGAEEGEKVGRLHENAMEKEKRETGA